MNEKPNILIVSSFWVDEGVGGVAKMSLVLARELAKDHQVTVLIDRWDAPVPRHEHCDGFELIFFRIRSPWSSSRSIRNGVGWLLALPSQLRQVHTIVRDRKIDIVQIRFPGPVHYIFRVLRSLGGPPYCISFHGSDVCLYDTHDLFSRLLVRWAISGASTVTAVSRSLAREAEKIFPDIGAISTIYNGKVIEDIDQTSGMSPATRTLSLPDKFFVNPANLMWHKGQTDLIRAWTKLPSNMNEVHLFIVGEQRESWGECVDLIQELDCGDRVHLFGPLSQPELFSLMGRAMGCIMASRREGFSGSVLEAGALRRALICTDIPSFREIIRHGENGLLVPLDDLEAMAGAVVRLAEDPALRKRLGEALHERVATEFTAERMAQQYLAIYREVLQG